jgi:hypothetical protein
MLSEFDQPLKVQELSSGIDNYALRSHIAGMLVRILINSRTLTVDRRAALNLNCHGMTALPRAPSHRHVMA